MAKISEYADAGTLDGSEFAPVDDSGVTKKTTTGDIAALNAAAISEVQDNLDAHAGADTDVHGIDDTSALVTSPDHSVAQALTMTQAAYDGLGPGRPATTIYNIVG